MERAVKASKQLPGNVSPGDANESKFTDAKSLLAGSVHEAFKLAEDECDANQSSPDSPATVAKKAASQEKIDKLFAAQAAVKKAALAQTAAAQSAVHSFNRQGSMAAPSRQGSIAQTGWKGLMPAENPRV
ncbi:uncharacterized protein LOC142358388 [Convolutriloba macropyga]|uniref:uncharacterized protein LOC142358388 n=1 Tax=Convolutriloba macropyga TaxID=536237 RepID=UPI003F51D3D5